jgi:uncharacterized protein involved in exopolysaccharide biosynthesis
MDAGTNRYSWNITFVTVYVTICYCTTLLATTVDYSVYDSVVVSTANLSSLLER